MTGIGGGALLEVEHLAVRYAAPRLGFSGRHRGGFRAVDDVSFAIRPGEVLGLVGESGCGKTTTGLAVLRLLDVAGGRIAFEGQDITHWTQARLRPVRRRMQLVHQDPYGSLNPRMPVRDLVAEPLDVHGIGAHRRERDDRVAALLQQVGLRPEMAARYPHEFSGGQRQRIAIARALAVAPALLVCDEPVSALDVSIRAQVVNLLADIRDRQGVAFLFIAHDLAVVRHLCDRVAVMYLGRIVEEAPRDVLFRAPLHPYTRALLAAVPVPDPALERSRPRPALAGEVASAWNPPAGCRFHPRCAHAMPVCTRVTPPLEDAGGRRVACHLHGPALEAPRDAAG